MNKIDILKELVKKPFEESWFEFKSNYQNYDEIGEYISAISNSCLLEGKNEGYIVWGIDDKTHKIIGTDFDFNVSVNNEPLQHYLTRMLYPLLPISFYELIYENKRVVILTIPKATTGLLSFNKQRFFRIGSSKVLLSKYPDWEAKLWQCITLGTPTMINTASPIQELSFNQLKSFYLSHGLEFNEQNFCINLHLKTSKNEYNMLACLLSDNGGVSYIISVFNNAIKTEKSLFSTKYFVNKTILNVIEEVIQFSSSLNVPLAIENLKTGVREDVYLFNQECFNEAIKNAFIHNNWLRRVAPQITFYNDRVEILSFSKLAPTQTIDGFYKGNSIPVNEDLSIVFLQTHLSERSGKGVPTIVNVYGKEAFEIGENSIKVTIPFTRNRIELKEKLHDLTDDKARESILFVMRKSVVIDYFSKNPNGTIDGLVKESKINKTAIQKIVKELKSKGILIRGGSDKKGEWKVLYKK